MADDTNTPFPTGGRRDVPDRGGRPGQNREAGGFRIRLSDNEMQAARALQDAFGLRSTVAVLGFSLRTLAQQLEQGQLESLLAEHRAQAGSRGTPGRGGERRHQGGEAPGRQEKRSGRGAPRIDPFARPSKPSVPVQADPTVSEPQPESQQPESQQPESQQPESQQPETQPEDAATEPAIQDDASPDVEIGTDPQPQA